jgi:hypothetical protein
MLYLSLRRTNWGSIQDLADNLDKLIFDNTDWTFELIFKLDNVVILSTYFKASAFLILLKEIIETAETASYLTAS